MCHRFRFPERTYSQMLFAIPGAEPKDHVATVSGDKLSAMVHIPGTLKLRDHFQEGPKLDSGNA